MKERGKREPGKQWKKKIGTHSARSFEGKEPPPYTITYFLFCSKSVFPTIFLSFLSPFLFPDMFTLFSTTTTIPSTSIYPFIREELHHVSTYVRTHALKKKASSSFLTPTECKDCLLYTSPSPRDRQKSRMPSSA